MNRNFPQLVVLVTLVCLTSAMILANDSEFDLIVRHIESRYHTDCTRVPFLGLASMVTKFTRPGGVSGMKLAIFQDLKYSENTADRQMAEVVRRAAGQHWQPLVQVRSKKDGNATLIYARESGKRVKLLLISMDRHNATVLELSLNPQTLMAWLEEPDHMGKRMVGSEEN